MASLQRLYLGEAPVSALAPFPAAGSCCPRCSAARRPLAPAALELEDGLAAVDLDQPATLAGAGLWPSIVATPRRTPTPRQAAVLHASRPDAVGLRWWPALEASWIDWTLFDRAAPRLSVGRRELSVEDPAMVEAGALLGLFP